MVDPSSQATDSDYDTIAVNVPIGPLPGHSQQYVGLRLTRRQAAVLARIRAGYCQDIPEQEVISRPHRYTGSWAVGRFLDDLGDLLGVAAKM